MSLTPTRNRVGLLKNETTYGVDPTPVAANAMLFMNSQIVPMSDKLERPIDRPYYGNNPFVMVGKRVEFTAECDLLGAVSALGVAAPLGPLYQTCGLAESLITVALTTPTAPTAATSTTGGSLAAGTQSYRVAAFNANGSTLASTAVTQATTGSTSTVTLTLGAAVPGAAGYSIFGRVGGSELWMADVPANATTWTDNGSITPAGALPTVNTTVGAAYTPISSSFTSSTLYFYEGGILFKMTGVRGYFDWDFAIKNYAKAKVKLTGILTIPTDQSFPAGIDWTPFQNPQALQTLSWQVSVNGISVNALSLSVTCGAQVVIHEGSNTREVYYSDRKPTGVLKVMKDLTLAAWNPWQMADDMGQGKIGPAIIRNTVSGIAGKNVNNRLRAQLEYPKPVDDGGIVAYEIPFVLIPSSAGNDEFSFGYN